MSIHPTAIIHEGAVLGEDCKIGIKKAVIF